MYNILILNTIGKLDIMSVKFVTNPKMCVQVLIKLFELLVGIFLSIVVRNRTIVIALVNI